MHGSTTGGDHDAVDAGENLIWDIVGGEIRHSVYDSWGDGVSEGLRLFVDFFHHKIIIAAFFGCSHIPTDMMDRRSIKIAVFIFDQYFIFGDLSNMVFL